METRKNALRLTAVDEAACAQGLSVGMTLADARARFPALAVALADPAADLALLMRLAEACRRFTPALALQAPDGLDLDVTGCAALFGGEARLLMAAGAVVQRAGLELRSALADTPALAYAAARFGGGGVVAPGGGAALLAPMPVEALRLEPQGCAVLRQLGFKHIGQLLALPRAALTRRLGPEALHRLDEALGERASPLELRLETPVFRAERRLFEPVTEAEQVMQVVGDLAVDLAVQLEGRALGGRSFALDLFRLDGTVKRLGVAASRPLRQSARIASLFAERLAGLNDGLQADFGFDQLRLTAERTQSLQAGGADLLQESGAPGSVEALADRLAARTGAPVLRLTAADRHTPEVADAVAALDAPATRTTTPEMEEPPRFLDTPLRPLRLFRPPQPIAVTAAGLPEGPPARFTWRRVTRTVVRAEGPERLEPEWARHPTDLCVRDYYRLEDEAGRRYWVFRQGRYDAPDPAGPPDPTREAVDREKSRREMIKPVRPPPKPEPAFKLKLASGPPPSRSPHLEPVEGRGDVARPIEVRPAKRPFGAPQDEEKTDRTDFRHAEEGSAGDCLEACNPPPAIPAWFLHGLFG
ncbi:DNA polymerase Y family protein [Caulobacter sp. S45]|uniref:Y-family DNA polymerase n=1 Tax=Caulobacter sp. S45 TaxID=1641861 RepID=UPI0015762CC8|nr:DNA polymerase Y family protein [Caulobacter sp. S45]